MKFKFLVFALASFAFLVFINPVTSAQSLPDPNANALVKSKTNAPPQGLPDPNANIPIRAKSPDSIRASGLPDAQTVKLPTGLPDLPPPSAARSMAERAKSAVDALASKIQSNIRIIDQQQNEISYCDARVQQLIREKEEVLRDYKQGMFCSECGRAKRQFENDAAFWAHIAENAANGRHAVPASPEQIAAKEKEYDEKIAALTSAMESKKAECRQIISAKQAESKDAWNQIQEGINLWRTATTLEQSLLYAHEEGLKRKEEADIKEAQQGIDKVETERLRLMKEGPLEKVTVDRLIEMRTMWEQVKNRAKEAAAKRFSYYYSDLREAQETKIKEYNQINDLIVRASQYQQYHPVTMGRLPAFNFSMGSVTASYIPDQLGLKFKFNSMVSSGLTATNGESYTEVQTFLELFNRVQISVGWKTTYTMDGVLNGPTFNVNIKPPSDKGKVDYPNRIDEKPKSGLPKIP
jgi:hypothetical protein